MSENKSIRIIAHLDMDAFFASVEERDKPYLRGLPIVVGADPKSGLGRGVVSTANYKAREYGIRSALPISKAWQFSEAAARQGKKRAVFLEVNVARYSAVSDNIFAVVARYAEQIERASIDESYFDLSFCGSYSKARETCQKIKDEVRSREKLTCSVGVGPNKLIAKIASDVKKPDGLTIVEEQGAMEFLAPMTIRKIPGVGPKTEELFRRMGIKLIRDLRKISQSELVEIMGKRGSSLYENIRGRDSSPIAEGYEAKSIGEQETFEFDTREFNLIFERLKAMCRSVVDRLRKDGFKSFRTIVITVRFSDFETKTRSHTLAVPADSFNILYFEAMKLLVPFLDKRDNPNKKLIRLVGVRVEKLE